MTMKASKTASAAYVYAIEQTWETARGLLTMYQVETGKATDVVVPKWSDLDQIRQLAFLQAVGDTVTDITILVGKLGNKAAK